MLLVASAGSHLFCFAAGVLLSGVGCVLFCVHKAAIIADLKAKVAGVEKKL